MKRLALLLLLTLAALLPVHVQAQDIELNKSRVLALQDHVASARGYIGGEAHDRYSVALKQGEKVIIKVLSKRNAADSYLTTSESFGGSEPVKFGHDDPHRWLWSGVIPVSQTYYIFVSAYPTARYKLIVTTRDLPRS